MSRRDAMKTKRIAAEEAENAALPMKRKEFEAELRKLRFCRKSGTGTRKQQIIVLPLCGEQLELLRKRQVRSAGVLRLSFRIMWTISIPQRMTRALSET